MMPKANTAVLAPDYAHLKGTEPLRTAKVVIAGDVHEVPVYRASYAALLIEIHGLVRWIPDSWEV